MSGGRSFDESEIRAEVFRTVTMADERRTGDSDRLAVGRVAAVDLAEGCEQTEIHGSLSETVLKNRLTLSKYVDHKIEGKLTSKSHSEAFMVGGSVAETFAGATLLLAGMSDDMVVGGGTRITAPLDVTMAGLLGMEEKIGSAFADGFFSENAPLVFDREFGPGVHNCGTVVFEGHVLQTQATGFMPLMQTWVGVRNLTLGSHFSQGGTQNPQNSPPAAAGPPPVPPKPKGRGGRMLAGAISRPDQIKAMADATDALEDLSDLATSAEDARLASNGSEAEVLAELRRGDSVADANTMPDGTVMVAPENPPTTFARYDVDEVRRSEKEWFNPDTGKMEIVVVEEAPSADNQFADWFAEMSAWAPPEDGTGSGADAPPRVPSPDTGAGAGNEGQPRSILKKPTEEFKTNARSRSRVGFAGDLTPDAYQLELEERINLPIRSSQDIFANRFGGVSSRRPSSAGGSQQQAYKLDRAAQTAAMEDMRNIEEDLLSAEWFRNHRVTADPAAEPDLYRTQNTQFEQFQKNLRQAYEADEGNRNFDWLYRQAVSANYQSYIDQGGDPSLRGENLRKLTRKQNNAARRHAILVSTPGVSEEVVAASEEALAANRQRLSLLRAWNGSARDLHGMQEDFIGAAETFVRHHHPAQSPAPGLHTLVEPGGGAAATNLAQARNHVKVMDPGGGAVPLSQVSDNALDRTIAYLDRVRGTGANPYLDALELEDVRNGDAYALLSKLLVDPDGQDALRSRAFADEDAKLSAEIATLQTRADGTQNRLTPLEARVKSLQKQVDKQQKQADRAFTESGRKKAAAKLELLQADLDDAKLKYRQERRRLTRQRKRLLGLKQERANLAGGPWKQTERRYEYLIDTLAIARDDLAAGYDPNVRLRYQADAFDELAGRSVATTGEDGSHSNTWNESVFARKKRNPGLSFREKSELSRQVADLLVDLAARYGVDNAFMSSDSSTAFNKAMLDDLLAGRWAGDLDDAAAAGAKASAGAANRLNPAAPPPLPPKKPRLRRTAGASSPAPVGLSFNSGSASAYDFASGTADSPADIMKFDDIMVQHIEDGPPVDLLQRGGVADVPLEHVEVELPPGQQADSGNVLDDLHRAIEGPETDDADLVDASVGRRETQAADQDGNFMDVGLLRQDMETQGQRWPSEQGPVTDSGGSSWILPTAGDETPLNPISPSALEPEAEIPPPIPPKKKKSRNPVPIPVEGSEWRGVTEAVPDTPSPNEIPPPIPKKSTSIATEPAAAPVETVPVPEEKAGMFGPTAAGKGTELRQDDAAFPTATLDSGDGLADDDDKMTFLEFFGGTPLAQPSAEPDEILPNPGQVASESPPPAAEPPAPPRSKQTAKTPGWWSDGDTVDPDSIPTEYVIQPDGLETPADGIIETYAAHSIKMTRQKDGSGVDPGFFDHRHVGLDTLPEKNHVVYEASFPSDWGQRAADYRMRFPEDEEGMLMAQRAKLPLGNNRTVFWAFNTAAADAALLGGDAKVSDEIIYADLDIIRQAIAPRPKDQLPLGSSYPEGGMLPQAIDARAKYRFDGAKIAPDLEKADAGFLEDIRTGLMGEDVTPLQRRAFNRRYGEGIAGTRQMYVSLAASADKNDWADAGVKYRRYIEAIDSYNEARIAKAADLLNPGDGAKLPDLWFKRADEVNTRKGVEDQHRFNLANWIRANRVNEDGKLIIDQGAHDILSRVAMDAEMGINPLARIDLETAYFQGMADAYYKGSNVPANAPNPYQKRIDSLAIARNHVKSAFSDVIVLDYTAADWIMTPAQRDEWIWAGKPGKRPKPVPKPMSSGGGQQVFGEKPPPLPSPYTSKKPPPPVAPKPYTSNKPPPVAPKPYTSKKPKKKKWW